MIELMDSEILQQRRLRGEMAIKALYRGAGLAPPDKIFWLPSPLAMTEAASFVKPGISVKPSIHHAWLGASSATPFAAPPHPIVALFQSMEEATPALPVLQQLRRSGARRVEDICVYRNDARLIDFYNLFLSDNNGTRDSGLLRCGRAPAANLEFIIPQVHSCYAADPPVTLHADGTGRLHCPDGPAAVYADGWKAYAVEGHWMPGYMMEYASSLARQRQAG